MLNESRVLDCFKWTLFANPVTYLCGVSGDSQKCQNVTWLPHINLAWNFQPIRRQTKKEMNHGPFLTFLSELWQPPPRNRVGQPVDGWFPSKSEKLWYASLACWTAQTDFFSVSSKSDMTDMSACASFRGLCARVHLTHIRAANHSDIRKPQPSSVSHCFPFSVFKCSLWSLFKVNRWRENPAVNVNPN